MINSITGTVTGRGADFIRIEVSGIEWHLESSSSSVRALPPVGENARVLTYLHVREDALKLFGFATEDERRLFLELLTVNGIGPRQALKLLSATTPERMIAMLEAEDTAALSALPGLGQKTAGKIVLQLRGKLTREPESDDLSHPDLVTGLMDMGYDRASAVKAVQQAAAETASDGIGPGELERETFRRALLILG